MRISTSITIGTENFIKKYYFFIKKYLHGIKITQTKRIQSCRVCGVVSHTVSITGTKNKSAWYFNSYVANITLILHTLSIVAIQVLSCSVGLSFQ